MGAVLGVCSAAQLACCCGSAACSLCCAACPSCKNSTSSRIMYAIMMLLGTIVACIMLSPGLQSALEKVPFCEGEGAESSVLDPLEKSVQLDCSGIVGYLAVYRLCFAMSLFFFVMALMMIGVKSSKDPRAAIQNGFWGIKYLVLIGAIIGAFFIPHGNFGQVWMYFGMIGGFLFILIQLVLIIDFAHSWAEAWVDKYEETESKGWYCALLSFTFFNYALAITAVVLFYVFYTTTDSCGLHKFFISFNLILCVIVSILSILPKIQDSQPRSGLLQEEGRWLIPGVPFQALKHSATFLPPAGHFLQPAGHFLQPTEHFLLPAGHFLLPAGHFLQPTEHFLLPAGHFLPPAGHFLQSAGHFNGKWHFWGSRGHGSMA